MHHTPVTCTREDQTSYIVHHVSPQIERNVPHMSENADATVRSARSSIASSGERPRNFSHGVLQKLRRNGGGAYETLAEIYKSKPGIQLNERNSWRFMQKHLTLCALIRQSRRAKKEENRLFAETSWKCIYNPRPS